MRSNSPGFWLTVGLVLAVVIVGTADALVHRIGQLGWRHHPQPH